MTSTPVSAYAAILFDCDGVLVDSEVVGLEDSVEYLAKHGMPFGREGLIRRFTGMRTDRFQAELRNCLDDTLARPATDEEFEKLFVGLIETRRAKRHTMQLVSGAAASLEVASSMRPRVEVAIASSSAQHFLDDKVNRYGLRPFVGTHVYSADDVDHGKPAPDIFLLAADKLGVPITDCLVIEDSPHGVTAGITAGADVWGFTGGGHCLIDHGQRLTENGAKRVFADHLALQAALSVL